MNKSKPSYILVRSHGKHVADKQSFLHDVVDGVGLALDPLPVHRVVTFLTSDEAAFAMDREKLVADRGHATTKLFLDVRISRRGGAGEVVEKQSYGKADCTEAKYT